MAEYWFRISIVPLYPPLCLRGVCCSETFFIRSLSLENPPIENSIKRLVMDKLLDLFRKEENYPLKLNVENFRSFLHRSNLKVNIEDTTIADLVTTAISPILGQIYAIKLLERASDCEACRLELSGQESHMAEGGCLYKKDF